MIRKGPFVIATLVAGVMPGVAPSQSLLTDKTNMYGMPGGLIDMPTAEMAPEGELAATVSHFGGTTRTNITFQPLPRISASFRYSAIENLGIGLTSPSGPYPLSTFYDRSFDLRYRIFDEGTYRPALAIGLRDFIGTGLYGGEYVVATKSLGERVRVTAGVGWGRLGSYNSFGNTGTRPPLGPSYGGELTTDQWFKGPVSGFGGIDIALTDKLSFQAEYSSDAYTQEVTAGNFNRKSPWNYGLTYKVSNAVQASVYSMYGTEIGARLSFSINAREPAVKGGAETAPMPISPRGSARDLGWAVDATRHAALRQAVASGLETDGLRLERFALSGTEAIVLVRNPKYDATAQAVGRTARVLSRNLPASVETFRITQVVEGMPAGSVILQRSNLEKLEFAPAANLLATAQFEDGLATSRATEAMPGDYPRFQWALAPYLKLSVFDPNSPVRADAGIKFDADYRFARGWVASGAVSLKATGNLDGGSPIGFGPLPPPDVPPIVRSDGWRYSQGNDPKIEHLTVAKYGRLGKNLYGRATFGYLEQAYAGLSTEVLWKPVSSRFALGAEVNYVAPRDYDMGFGLRSRATFYTHPVTGVATYAGDIPDVNGHLSAYYDFGNGFHGRVDAGRYLAGDWGATLSVDREFDNGWRVGAYVTKTDLSAAQFGEGSFDKGIRISIPLSWTTGQPNTTRTNTVIQSLARDGGAKLNVQGRLYDQVRSTHQPDVAKTWGKFWR